MLLSGESQIERLRHLRSDRDEKAVQAALESLYQCAVSGRATCSTKLWIVHASGLPWEKFQMRWSANSVVLSRPRTPFPVFIQVK